MNAKITIKKIGNHWYPDIKHNDPTDIILDEKIEKVLSKYDKNNYGIVDLYFYEQCEILSKGTLQFDEKDMLYYLTTDDDFNLRIYIDDHQFYISAVLLSLLEYQYNFNFQSCLYRIDFW